MNLARWLPLALAPFLGACWGTKARCELACETAEKCDAWTPKGDCVDYCVEHYENSSERCQEEFDDLADCLHRDVDCTYDFLECGAERNDAIDACPWVDPPQND